ncbi:glycosyltransferase [Paraburkholderia sp. BR13439]|uniref:glycosyltransferase n=1 Tax=Paraburkholderia sp. BR13439 TaxID=3236996 RepID=UPI0034CD5F47
MSHCSTAPRLPLRHHERRRRRKRIIQTRLGTQKKHYIVSADADCTVDPYWLHALIEKMVEENGDIGTCNYYYNEEAFRNRPTFSGKSKKPCAAGRCRFRSSAVFPTARVLPWSGLCTTKWEVSKSSIS